MNEAYDDINAAQFIYYKILGDTRKNLENA